jgi:threonine synthase
MAQFFQLETLDGSEQAAPTTHALTGAKGDPFTVRHTPPFMVDGIGKDDYSLGRYAAFLLPPAVRLTSLGEGWTPLLEGQIAGRRVFFKMEGANPTGSFKDRGAAVLVSLLKSIGIERVHDDSSGNAGAALAAYAARAGLDATLFVPAYAAPAKLAQVQLYGAGLRTVKGPRSAATEAAVAYAEESDSYYASHAHHAFIPLANRSIAYELWEQMGTPDVVILPVGQGTQLLGLYEGFGELLRAGLIERMPQLIAVQAARCAPLYHALHGTEPKETEGETLAEGIRIANPVREGQLLEAVRETGGDVLTVSEERITEGLRALLAMGIGCEPTCAVVWKAFRQVADRLPPDAKIVLSITGNGLKIPGPAQFLED